MTFEANHNVTQCTSDSFDSEIASDKAPSNLFQVIYPFSVLANCPKIPYFCIFSKGLLAPEEKNIFYSLRMCSQAVIRVFKVIRS